MAPDGDELDDTRSHASSRIAADPVSKFCAQGIFCGVSPT